MKTKAVIWRPNRTNAIYVPKQKDIRGKIFHFEEHVYFIDSECQQITEQRGKPWQLWRKQYFATFYYVEGTAKPVPTPNFGKVESVKIDAEGNAVLDANGLPVMEQVFPQIIDNGTKSEELDAIFNPWLYRILGHMGANQLQANLQFYLILGIAGGVAYIGWQMFKLPELVAKAVKMALAGEVQP